MDVNQAQAHCLVRWSWISRATASIGLRELPRHDGEDLCGLLVRYRKITPEQAVRCRQTCDTALARLKATPTPPAPEPALPDDFDADAETHPVINVRSMLSRLQQQTQMFERLQGFEDEPPATSPEPEPPTSESGRRRRELRTVRYTVSDLKDEAASDSLLDLRIPNYQIIHEIASGSMGIVLHARHLGQDEDVALKVLFRDETDTTIIERFRREARVLAGLDHPHIVDVIEYGYVNEDPFLAMEYIRGSDLEAYIRSSRESTGRLPDLDFVTRTGIAIAEALDYCHQRGLVHRDVKPKNVVIEERSERPVLVDFGLVKRDPDRMTSGINVSLSAAGEVVGTPSYMAPEQMDARGSHGDIEAATDVWGLGATLFHLMTGATHYEDTTLMGLMLALLTREPRRIRELQPEAPEWLDQLVADCLNKDGTKRPELPEVIRRLKAGRGA